MENLNDTIIFAKVAELQGISPAARALRIPKSKVSRRMQALEDELGIRLLERSTRSVHLTEAGGLFYQHCKRIVEEAESARTTVSQLMETPRGRLRINASVSTGRYLLAPHLGEFLTTYPEIELNLQLDNRQVDIIAEGYDLVVRVGDLPDSNLISKRLGIGTAKLYAAPEYLERAGTPKRISDLPGHRILVMSDVPKPDEWVLRNRKEEKTIRFHPHSESNDFSILVELVSSGCGIALIPDFIALEALQAGRIQAVLPAWQAPEYHFHALYPSARGRTLKLRAWIDFFSERLSA